MAAQRAAAAPPAPARTLRNSLPANVAGAALGRGDAPAVSPGPGWCRSSAPPARALLRARGGRWLSPGRGPRRPRRGGRERPFALGRGNGGKRPAGRSPAADAAPAQCAAAPFLAGEAAPFRKLVHFPVKFACPPPPMCYTGGRSKNLTKIEKRPPARRPFSLLDNIGDNCRAPTFEIEAFSELFAGA